MPESGRLFPLVIRRTEPAGYGTAACKSIGVGDDGLTYILKRVADAHPLIPVSEWVCTKLAEHVGLAVSPCHIATLPGGETAFASREEGGLMDTDAAMLLLEQPEALRPHLPALARWYAFDVFTYNVDRHIANFLFRRGRMGMALMGIDFSQALLTEGWPVVGTPLPTCNTSHTRRTLEAVLPYPSAEAAALANRLASVSDEWLATTLSPVPEQWLDARVRTSLIRWWGSARHKRLSLLHTHFASGRYLRILANPRRS